MGNLFVVNQYSFLMYLLSSFTKGCQPFQIKPNNSSPEIPTTCETECTNPTYTIPYNDDIYKGVSSYALSTVVSEIQTDLMSNGPVVARFKVFEDFYHYQSGVYVQTTTNGFHGHAVRVIGWGQETKDDGSTVDYWLAANSWGTDWGDKGYFRIRRGTNECGFENAVVAGLM